MHIAFLTPEYPHERVISSAGIGTSIKNLIESIQDAKSVLVSESWQESWHQIKFTVFIYGQRETSCWKENGINFHLIAHKHYKIGGFFRYRKYINTYVNRFIKEDKINVIEAPDWTGITAFMKFSIPLIVRLHGTDTYFCKLENRAQKKKNYFLENKALHNANAIVSVSSFTAKKTTAIFKISTPIEVIYNGIDVNFFSPVNEASLDNTILYFGSVIRKKGVLELAEAFKELLTQNAEAQLIFLGKDVIDAKTRISTKQLIQEVLGKSAQKQVSFVSQVPYDDVKKCIAEASVICLPSHAEAFPMTWLEAMAMEKPMVTSNIGWAPEVMIHEKTGLMVDPNDTKQLANALMHMLEKPEQASLYGKEARRHLITYFDPKAIAKKNVQFYQKVIQG